VEIAQKQGIDTPLINASRMVNEKMPLEVARMVREALEEKGKHLNSSVVGILGVAYKGNVADARESPAEPLIKELLSSGAMVYAHDPHVSDKTVKSFGAKPTDMERALKCDCVVLVTDHHLYRQIKPSMIKNGLLICTRPILDPEIFREAGVTFKGVGRS
jgi:UDP-N-acetyl-D-mannosaminuronic acid dehydrogenase